MRKLLYLTVAIIALGLIFVSCFSVIPQADKGKPGNECTTIQDGELTYFVGHYLAGQPYIVGYDPYGYNYQAHMFKGFYANATLGKLGFPPYEGDDEAYLEENPTVNEGLAYWIYRDVQLIMKWSDTWLSNKDCDNDGLLDRPSDFNSYIGSGAWLTNHQRATEEGCEWDYFVKMVAKPEADFVCADVGGTQIWGSFCRIQQIYNSNCEGDESEGVILLVNPAGFGAWK